VLPVGNHLPGKTPRREGVQTRAAERLGIRALRDKLNQYGFREEAADRDFDPLVQSPKDSCHPQE